MVTVFSKKTENNLGDQETTQETTQETAVRILDLIRENPNMNRKKMAQVLGNISEDGVKYHLAKLLKEAVISRIGSTKGGYWKVNEN